MSRHNNQSLQVSRGIALHKMIKLITLTLGGEAFLNFMGNEFGHPEWIDFPTERNNYSMHYCRRQWSLMYNKELRFMDLACFDRQMNYWESLFNVGVHGHQYVTLYNEGDKVIVYEKGDLVFIFNFHTN